MKTFNWMVPRDLRESYTKTFLKKILAIMIRKGIKKVSSLLEKEKDGIENRELYQGSSFRENRPNTQLFNAKSAKLRKNSTSQQRRNSDPTIVWELKLVIKTRPRTVMGSQAIPLAIGS